MMPMFHAGAAFADLAYTAGGCSIRVVRDYDQAAGMTECCAVATVLAPEDHRRALRSDPGNLASAGRPVIGSAVKVVSRDGVELPAGAVGEVLVHGEQLMSGYWGLDDATRTTLVDGWLHTGDAGHLDEEGFLFISDRVKDMIISGGENIYPREIEDVLFGIDGIADAAVVGVPSDKWGESPVAVVVASPDSVITDDDVLAHCRAHLARFKAPVDVLFVDVLPRNAVGKVLKRELRAPFWDGRARSVN
ncbi:AMP-binding enzyme [Gordonia sp. KTR9]|uniref:AMP-binding enzyme n=1 Tax=Gordonia sp. KTR9 TaxID=337191 RepID=UPI001EE673EC|nr:AMP-binding protein [Gordonia sp. KTR9]